MTSAIGRSARQALGRSAWRFGRRARSAYGASRRGAGLLGLRRHRGPPTQPGASVGAQRATASAVPIVVCLWRRPHFLERTLRSVAAQTHTDLKLYVWNNNPAMRNHVDTVVAHCEALDVEVEHSRRNVGGFGRFYAARRLAERHAYVVFLDDDQLPAPDCVSTMLAEATPSTTRGMWAFNFRGMTHFGDRIDAEPGEQVKYAGTGGLICDTRIFREPGLFDCPRRFWFVEDLWLSYYADHVLGWHLFKSAARVDGVADHLDQSRALGPTKDRLFRYLVRRRGWAPVLVERGGTNARVRTVV